MYSEIFGKVDQNSYYRTTCKLGCLLDVSGTDRKEVRFFSPFLGKNRRTFFDLLDVSGHGRREKRSLYFPFTYCLMCSMFREKEGNKILISPDHCEEEARIA